jgi:hypothetical protein
MIAAKTMDANVVSPAPGGVAKREIPAQQKQEKYSDEKDAVSRYRCAVGACIGSARATGKFAEAGATAPAVSAARMRNARLEIRTL